MEKNIMTHHNSALRHILCVLCVLCGLAVSEAAEPRSLTLDQALSLAMEKNRDIEQAREYARSVQGKYVEERSAALPQIGLYASTALSKDKSQQALMGSSQRQTSTSLDLTLTQPLFTWGKLSAAIRAAEVGLKTADQQLRIYQQAARRDVATAWHDILLAKELHRLARENLSQKQRHQDEAGKKFAAGIATDYDVLAAEVAAENARPEVIRSANSINVARERLRFLLASAVEMDADGSLELASIKTSHPTDFAAALEIARTKRPELADLRLRTGIYSELLTIAAAENKPRLELRGGAGWRWLSLDDPGPNREADGAAWNVGLYLSFPFFDGLRTSGRVTQARSDLHSKQIEEQKLLDSIALELRTTGYALREADEMCQAVAGTVRQAEKLLKMAEQGYQFGVKIRLEVDDAQLNLLQATSSLARAERDYRVAAINYAWALGTLGE
jgi:HAE1 family hydrophobic/amphiphilic exporter-1